MNDNCNLILIGGSSHTGKSTLAQAIGDKLGWPSRSTDYLARHPGRPWSRPDWAVSPHVEAYYRTSDMDFLLADVLRHYHGTIWPKVMEIVTPLLKQTHSADPPHPVGADANFPLPLAALAGGEREKESYGLVLEGSAVLPELVVTLPQECIRAAWLTCSEDCFRERMYAESEYISRTAEEQRLIDTFLARTLAFDAWMMEEVRRLGLPWLAVDHTPDSTDLVYLVMQQLKLA